MLWGLDEGAAQATLASRGTTVSLSSQLRYHLTSVVFPFIKPNLESAQLIDHLIHEVTAAEAPSYIRDP